MGASSTKLVQDIVNNVTNETVNNVFQSDKTSDSLLADNIIKQNITIKGNIVAKEGCEEIDIGKAKIASDIRYKSTITNKMTDDIKNQLSSKIANKLRQTQKLMQEMGANWGSINQDDAELHLKNIVKNIVKNSISQEILNQQLAQFNNGIYQHIDIGGDITCSAGKIIIGSGDIALKAQVEFVANNITDSIMSNNLTQSLTNDVSQSQSVTQTGIASVIGAIGKMLIPLAIIAGLFFLGVGIFGGQGVKAVTNWKLWLAVGAIFGLYILVAYFVKFWPFKQHYSPEIGPDKFRTGSCKPDKNGPFDSKSKCEADLQDPKSMWFENRFWGYEDKCKRYPQLVNTEKDKTIYAQYATEEDCNAAHKKIYVPQWTPGGSKSDYEKIFGSQSDGADYCDKPYGYYELECQELDNPDTNTLQRPFFTTAEECKAAVQEGAQEKHFLPNCSYNSDGKIDQSCQYVINTIIGGPSNGTDIGQNTPFKTKEDICTM